MSVVNDDGESNYEDNEMVVAVCIWDEMLLHWFL